MLSRADARAFYDRFGARQDAQGWYEDPPVARLVERGVFAGARSVVELGCGTGRVAERLLREVLPRDARYLALDSSPTMVGLARERLAPFRARAEVRLTDGDPVLPVPDRSTDRVVSTYVLDLLSEPDIGAFVADAHRALADGGRLCLVGLTDGERGLSRLVSSLWRRVHRRNPSRVGGCRPLCMAAHLPRDRWRVEHREVVTAWTIPSEILVATPAR